MNMSGAVGDETRRRVANVVHDDGDDHYDEELDPPAANGVVVVVVVVVGGGDGGGDLGDIDDDAPPSESSSLIVPSPPSSSHEGDLCRRLHPPRVDARRRRRRRRRHDRDDDDASRGSIPACLVGGTTTTMLMILSSLALLFLLFGTDDVVVPPPRSMSSSSSLRVVEEDPRIIVVVRDDPPSPPLLSSAEKRGDAIFTPDMIADDTAAGREYVGARVEVPEARRRCKYVVDAIKARNSNEGGGGRSRQQGIKGQVQGPIHGLQRLLPRHGDTLLEGFRFGTLGSGSESQHRPRRSRVAAGRDVRGRDHARVPHERVDVDDGRSAPVELRRVEEPGGGGGVQRQRLRRGGDIRLPRRRVEGRSVDMQPRQVERIRRRRAEGGARGVHVHVRRHGE